MVPLPLYRSSGASLKARGGWRIIDPGVLSPWNVMSWGLRQLKGIVVGWDSNLETSPRLQVQELVLVENLKVCLVYTCLLEFLGY